LKISTVIPTCEAAWNVGITFRSLPELTRKPDEIMVVMDGEREDVEETSLAGVPVKIFQTRQRGAAAKRNLGVEKSSGVAILFVDDDVEFRPGCLEIMERALTSEPAIGGVGVFIENQRFQEQGLYSRMLYRMCGGWGIRDFGGKCFGPLINIHARLWEGGAEFRETEWLNSTCTLYRREALPKPAFEAGFTGYSFMEDVALSRRVRKRWKIGVARDAWIIHHSRPAPYKQDAARLHEMGLVNRFHILREVEGWGLAKAALAISWLELLSLPAKLRAVMRQPENIGGLRGSVWGLAKIWGQVF
jgi:glycosyltransferase involved in cell wall biosynthesis